MSLTVTLQNALSAIQFTQTALQITSNNVANATTEGYTRKIVTPLSNTIDGTGAGVITSDIIREVDAKLINQLRTELSEIGRYVVRDQFLTSTQDMFGSLAGDSSLGANITDLASKLEALAAFPEDTTLRLQVVNAAVSLTRQFNDMASKVQSLRSEADQDITAAINVMNSEITKIAELNTSIAKKFALGEPIADLEDHRDIAIAKLAEYIDITTFTQNTGEIIVLTGSGKLLADTAAHPLSHTAASNVDATVSYPGSIAAINLDGLDITTEITSGRLGALVELRDTTLPNLATELITLATRIRDEINAIHNDGAGYPAANTLTGTRTVVGADAISGGPVNATGTVRFAVVDANGNAIAAPYDLDLTTIADVDAFVVAFNANLGAVATAVITNGKLVISADNAANSIAINERTGSMTDGTQTKGFSHYFGLNDFFVGDASNNFARTIAVRSDIVSNPQLMSRGELTEAAFGIGASAITSGGNTIIQRLADEFGVRHSFAAAGDLPATTTTFTDYGAQIMAQNAAVAAEYSSTLKFKELLLDDLEFRAQAVSGVNVDEEMANLIVLQMAFAASAKVMSVTSDLMDLLIELA